MSARTALALGAALCCLLVAPMSNAEEQQMHPSLEGIFAGLQRHVGTCTHVWREHPEKKNYFTLRTQPGGPEYEFDVSKNSGIVYVLKRVSGYDFQSRNGHDLCRSSEIGLDIESGDIRIAAYAMCKDNNENALADRYNYGDEDTMLKDHWQNAVDLYLPDIKDILTRCDDGK